MEKRILILGSGYISSCLINYLLKGPVRYELTLGSNVQEELTTLSNKFHIATVLIDAEKDTQALSFLIQNSHLIISLLPNDKHFQVAKSCIFHKVPMIHASYQTPDLLSLHEEAESAGVLILGEMGLDPGIDHLLAMKCIDEIHSGNAKVVSFSSFCGGLPSPKYKDGNPLKYKFSWSPRTALKNLRNSAKYMKNKTIIEVQDALEETKNLQKLKEYDLEYHPNRDALIYIDKYSIPNVKSILRGTLRYRGFKDSVKTIVNLGLLEEEKEHLLDPEGDSEPISWRDFVSFMSQRQSHCHSLSKQDYKVLEDLGLLSQALVDKLGSPLDTLSKHLERTLKYSPGEQDMIILHLEIESRYPRPLMDGSVCTKKEFREVDFIVYGDPSGSGSGYSAMAKTVAYTLGLGSKLILNGSLDHLKGVQIPFTRDIYTPVLEGLTEQGMFAIERISET